MSATPQREDDDRAGGSSSATFCFVPAEGFEIDLDLKDDGY